MLSCVWFVSNLDSPWERAIVGNMAAALRARGVELEFFSSGGVADFGLDRAFSWNSMAFPERLRKLFSRALWHLWGPAPVWWSLVRAQSRTVHTSLAASVAWRGHPTRLLQEQVGEGENLIKPTFETHSTRREDAAEEAIPSIFLDLRSVSPALNEVLTKSERPVVDLKRVRFNSASAKSGLFIAGKSPSDALLAAFLTAQGLTVAGPDSSYLKEILGDEGYLTVKKDESDSWARALELAFSSKGRALSVSTRHHLSENYSTEASAQSLLEIYSTVSWSRTKSE